MTLAAKPSSPVARTLLLLASGLVVVGVTAGWLLSRRASLGPEDAGTPGPRRAAVRGRGAATLRPLRRPAWTRSSASLMLRTLEGAGPGLPEVTELETARASFDGAIEELERRAEQPRALRKQEWEQVYRAANDSFSALSSQLNVRNPADAKELDDAYARLVRSLAVVQVGNE